MGKIDMKHETVEVIVIDDEDVIRDNLESYMVDEGLSVEAFENAELALEYLKDNKAGLSVVDMRLPGIDGNEFILKAYQLNPEMRFIIHTGSSNYFLPDALKKLGITENFVLRKPLPDIRILIDKVKFLLAN
jgi:DNA-binding NtrC family response regulator